MRKLTVVGMGPGSQSCLTLEALEALRKADLIVGAGRLLETGGMHEESENSGFCGGGL